MSRTGDEHGPLVDLGNERPQVPARARNLSPIVPRASIAGRALVAVVAIMTFLASITTGAVLLVSASAAEWQSEVASEITIQVRPAAGRDLDRDAAAVVQAIRTQPGFVEIKPFSKDESAKLLEPWLGSGLSFEDLPVPRVIVARVTARNGARSRGPAQPGGADSADRQRRRSPRLDRADALDDRRHRVRRHRHPRSGDHRHRHFGIVRHPRRDGGEPSDRRGAALRRRRRPLHRQPLPAPFSEVGPAGRRDRRRCRDAAFGFSESIASWFSGTPVGDQFAALLGTFSLRPSGYLALAAQAVLIAAITAWASRRTLFATLDDID